MADPHQDNPAGRFFAMVNELKAVPPNTGIGRAWRMILGLPNAADHQLFGHVADVGNLIDRAVHEVRRFEGEINVDLHLRWVAPAERMMSFAARFTDGISHMQGQMSESDLLALEHCMDLLHRRAPEVVLEEGSIDGLIGLVRQAIDGILADEGLSPAVRFHLVGRLREVEIALQRVQVVGYEGVNEAMDAFTGAVMTTTEARESAATTGWLARIWATIMNAATGVQQVAGSADSVIKLIESAGGGA